MKRLSFIAALFGARAAAQATAQSSGCPTYPEVVQYIMATQERNLWSGAEYMDRYWSLKFRLAEMQGADDGEWKRLVADAPRTLGDGKPYSQHYWDRAESTVAKRKEAEQRVKSISDALRKKYGAGMFRINEDGTINCRKPGVRK